MSNDSHDVAIKWIEPQTVVSVRRSVTDQAAIAEEIARLHETVGGALAGAPIARVLGLADDGGFDVEIAFPVADDASIDGMERTTLPGDYIFSARHVGPYVKTDEADGVREATLKAAGWASERSLLIGDNPTRYIYHEGPETHGDRADAYVTEVQISYHWPVWLESLREGIAACTDAETAAEVTAGGAALIEETDADVIRAWVLEATAKLDDVVADKQVRACVLQDCAHHYPRAQLHRMRAVYDEIGDLRRFIDRLSEDKDLFPAKLWLDESGDRPLVYIQRGVPPWNREAYDAATDPVEKRYHQCFCVMVREAIRTGEPISPDFCNCSGGWFVQMWEAILDRRLRIDVVESVLQGHDRCLFAVYVPEELL